MDEAGTPGSTGEQGDGTDDAARARRADVDGADRSTSTAGSPDGRPSRRLVRAPGERFRGPAMVADDAAEAAAGTGSVARAAGFAAPAAIIALVVYVAFAGPLAFSAGLVIIGIFAGRIIGLSARVGAARSIASDQVVVVALIATLAWFVAAQVGTWIFARNEGGVLPILDYLLETFGPVVPLVAIASVLAAWWSAR